MTQSISSPQPTSVALLKLKFWQSEFQRTDDWGECERRTDIIRWWWRIEVVMQLCDQFIHGKTEIVCTNTIILINGKHLINYVIVRSLCIPSINIDWRSIQAEICCKVFLHLSLCVSSSPMKVTAQYFNVWHCPLYSITEFDMRISETIIV